LKKERRFYGAETLGRIKGFENRIEVKRSEKIKKLFAN